MAQTSRISRNNTTVRKTERGTCFSVTLHSTEIVKAIGSVITLNTGGWNTATTRTRMNQVANELCDSGFVVGTKKDVLSVHIGRVMYSDKIVEPYGYRECLGRAFANVEFDRTITFDYMTGEVYILDGVCKRPGAQLAHVNA